MSKTVVIFLLGFSVGTGGTYWFLKSEPSSPSSTASVEKKTPTPDLSEKEPSSVKVAEKLPAKPKTQWPPQTEAKKASSNTSSMPPVSNDPENKLPPHIEKAITESMNWANQGKPKKAEEILEKALEKNPEDQDLLLRLAHLNATAMQNFEKEAYYINDLYEKHPESPIANAAKGDLLARQEKFTEAADYLKRAIDKNKNPPPQAHTALAANYMNMNQPDKAASHFQAALDKSYDYLEQAKSSGAEDLTYHRQLVKERELDMAYFLRQRGNLKESLEYYNKVKAFYGPMSPQVKNFERSGPYELPAE